MEVLLEMVAQREIQERTPVRRQLHAGAQPALNNRQIAGGEVTIQLMHIRPNLQPIGAGKRGWLDARAGHDNHPQVRHAALRLRERADDTAEQMLADAGAANGDDADVLVGPIAQLVA